MKYSFIIPAYNEEKYIKKCITSIYYSTSLPRSEYEIIVVCNKCTDNTSRIASELGCIVINSNGDNIAKVRNEGARIACNKTLIFVDADSYFDWQLMSAIDESAIAGGALIELDHMSRIGKWIERKYNTYCLTHKIFSGTFFFIDKDIFNHLGMFNEQLYILEDMDLSIRVNNYAGRYGYKTQLIKNHRIITSDRKLKLHSYFEHIKFWLHFLWNQEKVVLNREFCNLWYSGRRELSN